MFYCHPTNPSKQLWNLNIATIPGQHMASTSAYSILLCPLKKHQHHQPGKSWHGKHKNLQLLVSAFLLQRRQMFTGILPPGTNYIHNVAVLLLPFTLQCHVVRSSCQIGTNLVAPSSWPLDHAQGSDKLLGQWSYIELTEKNNKCIIILFTYHVCHQKFDMASNTASAQQIWLLQNSGIVNHQPWSLSLQDSIYQINQW